MDRRKFVESLMAMGFIGTINAGDAFSMVKNIPTASPKARKGKFDENLVVFISDLHTNPSGYQPDKCRKIVQDILKLKPLPQNVITFGDLAYLTGKRDEYALAREILAPLEEAGIKVTHGMGNHDRRTNFAEVFPEHAKRSLLKDRFVNIVETPYADIIMLDSLQQGEDDKTWITPGALDEAQVAWLKETLANYKKPVFVTAHHPITETKIQSVLLDSPTCCGYIHGHDHRWRVDWFKRNYSDQRMIRILCLPSTGHWGDIGYTTFRLGPDQAVAELHQSEFFFPKPVDNPAERPVQWQMITDDHKGLTCTFSYKI